MGIFCFDLSCPFSLAQAGTAASGCIAFLYQHMFIADTIAPCLHFLAHWVLLGNDVVSVPTNLCSVAVVPFPGGM